MRENKDFVSWEETKKKIGKNFTKEDFEEMGLDKKIIQEERISLNQYVLYKLSQ